MRFKGMSRERFRIRRTICALALVGSVLVGTSAQAGEKPDSHPQLAFNVWTGLGKFYWLHGNQGFSAVAYKLGGDMGYRFSRRFSILAMVDYQATPSDNEVLSAIMLGPGVRYQPDIPLQIALGLGTTAGSAVAAGQTGSA
jgi:hypothetical protein